MSDVSIRDLPYRLIKDPESASCDDVRRLALMCIARMAGLNALTEAKAGDSVVVVQFAPSDDGRNVVLTTPSTNERDLNMRAAEFAARLVATLEAIDKDMRAHDGEE